MPSVRDMLQEGAQRLSGDEARAEAEILLAHVLGQSRPWLVAHAEDDVGATQAAAFDHLMDRRASGEPVAYLVGSRGFHALDLEVTPDVLIPRPETELLVELALQHIRADGRSLDAAQRNPGSCAANSPDFSASGLHPGYTVVDLGTGSGAVAFAIAKARPDVQVLATDASEGALAVACRNAGRLGIGNVEFAHGDWCAALGDARFELMVSNPPYVAEGDPHLGQGDLRFEPRTALASGVDGLDAIRAIVRDARAHLHAGGWLLFEHGFDQGAAVRALLELHGYRGVFTERDLGNHERVTGGQAGAETPQPPAACNRGDGA